MAIRINRSPSMVDYGRALYDSSKMDEEYGRMASLLPQLIGLGQRESQFQRSLALQQQQRKDAIEQAKIDRQREFEFKYLPAFNVRYGAAYGAI